jgi:hypothetical protein
LLLPSMTVRNSSILHFIQCRGHPGLDLGSLATFKAYIFE